MLAKNMLLLLRFVLANCVPYGRRTWLANALGMTGVMSLLCRGPFRLLCCDSWQHVVGDIPEGEAGALLCSHLPSFPIGVAETQRRGEEVGRGWNCVAEC